MGSLDGAARDELFHDGVRTGGIPVQVRFGGLGLVYENSVGNVLQSRRLDRLQVR